MTARHLTLRQTIAPLRLPIGTFVLIGLAFLTFMGVLAGVWRLWYGLGATTALTDAVSWGIWIGFDFLLIAFSGAGFTMAAVVHVFHLRQFQPALRPAILAGLMGYVAVLLLLVLDLGRPDRFYSFIINWNIHSPLFEISWCVLLYTTILLLEVSPYLFERLGWVKPVRLFFLLITPITIIGVSLSSLHQSTLGTLYLNMPHRLDALWYTPIMPVQFFVSSIMAGLSIGALSYLLACHIHHRPVSAKVPMGLGKGLVGVTFVYLALKVGAMAWSGQLPRLLMANKLSMLMWLELLVFGIFPALLFLIPSLRARPTVWWLAPLLALIGVGLNRFSATLFAQTPPVGSAAYTPHILEWLTTFGIISAACLAWYLGIRLLIIFDSKLEHKYHH